MIIVGVDPGLNGGLAAVNTETGAVEVAVMPVAGKEIDAAAVYQWIFQQTTVEPAVVYLENVHAMPKNGSIAGFKLGEAKGIIEGVVGALGLPLRMVAPQTWKAVVLKGTRKDKAAAVDFCVRAYPSVNLRLDGKKVPHDGLADAICIAEYGWLEQRRTLPLEVTSE